MLDGSLIFDGTVAATGSVTGTSISASATTQASLNVIDLLVARDLGADHPLTIHIIPTVAFTTTNSATLTIELDVSSDSTTWYSTQISEPAIPASQIIQGAPIWRPTLDPNQILNATSGVLKAPGRYLRLLYTVGTGVFTAAHNMMFAYIAPREDRNQFTVYKNNYSALVATGEI